MSMTIGSLFSGIGGLELGLERATGAHTIWQVEADAFCRRVLDRHWPDAARFDDVCTATALPAVDIMCGGFPCQDISFAGRGEGLDGARSGLWREYLRLIGEGRPTVVVAENVPALTSRGLSRVLSDLANIGYVGSWNVVSAASVGAPHLRKRLFVVAANTDRVAMREQRWWAEAWARAAELGQSRPWGRVAGDTALLQHHANSASGEGVRGAGRGTPEHADADVAGVECRQLADADSVALGQGRPDDAEEVEGRRHLDRSDVQSWCGWHPASPVRRMDDGVPTGLDGPRRRRPAADRHRLKALGNAVVPQVAEVVGSVVAEVLQC